MGLESVTALSLTQLYCYTWAVTFKTKKNLDLQRSSRHLPCILNLLVLVLVFVVSAFLAPQPSFDI